MYLLCAPVSLHLVEQQAAKEGNLRSDGGQVVGKFRSLISIQADSADCWEHGAC